MNLFQQYILHENLGTIEFISSASISMKIMPLHLHYASCSSLSLSFCPSYSLSFSHSPSYFPLLFEDKHNKHSLTSWCILGDLPSWAYRPTKPDTFSNAQNSKKEKNEETVYYINNKVRVYFMWSGDLIFYCFFFPRS